MLGEQPVAPAAKLRRRLGPLARALDVELGDPRPVVGELERLPGVRGRSRAHPTHGRRASAGIAHC